MALDFSFADISEYFGELKNDINDFFDDTSKKITNSLENQKNEFIDFTKELKSNEKELIDTTVDKVDKKFDSLSETASTLAKEINSILDKAIDKVMEKTGATITKLETATDNVIEWVTDAENWKRVGATVSNVVISLTKSVLKIVESIGDTLLLLVGVLGTTGTGYDDLVNGITTGEFTWSTTKTLWSGIKETVTYEWVDKLSDMFYDTKAGKWLDNHAYSPFKSDGLGCKITEGVGYAVGIILISILTAGIGSGGAAASSLSSALSTISPIIATASGVGKYTAEEWNKNDVTVEYNGKQIKLDIDYQKYLEITELKDGKSTTIDQQVQLEDGSFLNITYTITKNGNKYDIVDSNGNPVEIKGINESSTVKGLAVGSIKGFWEGLQYWVGGKIGTSSFSKITEHITNAVAKNSVISTIRIGLDAVTGAVEVPFQTVVTAFSEDISLKEAFEECGGWETVKSQALIASVLSFAGEAFSFRNNVLNSQIESALKESNTSILEQIFKNTKPKRLNQILARLDDSQFKEIVDTGVFKNLDDSVKTAIANSLDSSKLKMLTDSLTSKEISKLIKNVDDKTFAQIVKQMDSSELKKLANDSNIATLGKITKNLDDSQLKQLAEMVDTSTSSKILATIDPRQLNSYVDGLSNTKLREILSFPNESSRNLLLYADDSKLARLNISIGQKLEILSKVPNDSVSVLKYIANNKGSVLDFRIQNLDTNISNNLDSIKKMLGESVSDADLDNILKQVTADPSKISLMYDLGTNVGRDFKDIFVEFVEKIEYDMVNRYELTHLTDKASEYVELLNSSQSDVKFTLEQIETYLATPKKYRKQYVESILKDIPGYEAKHLETHFMHGGIKFTPVDNISKNMVGGFATDIDQVFEIIKNTDGGKESIISNLEDAITANSGYLSKSGVVVFNSKAGFALPKGGEYNAWEGYHKPFGYTEGKISGGLMSEAVTTVDVAGAITDKSVWQTISVDELLKISDDYIKNSEGFSTFSEYLINKVFS